VAVRISSRSSDGTQSFQEFDSDTDGDQALQELLNEHRAAGYRVSKRRRKRADTYTITNSEGEELMHLEYRRS
jgi:hypothetical protein